MPRRRAALAGPAPAANRLGIGQVAFEIDDVHGVLDQVVAHGGHALAHVQSAEVPGKGKLRRVHATDHEGNIIEQQAWHLGNGVAPRLPGLVASS